jgi:N-acyl-D-aspartate/D-glutamate deacylase
MVLMGFSADVSIKRNFLVFCRRFALCGLLIVGVTTFCSGPQVNRVDLLITNARIVDGTGNPWYRGWVAVSGCRILSVGTGAEPAAERHIDAGDRVLAPGFIDLHNHCDNGLFEVPGAESFVRQGVTTIIGGPDGGGAVDMGAYLADLDTLALGLNACFTVGHNTVRSRVMGTADREAGSEELEEMKRLVDKAMQEGSIGISTALKYVPGAYSSTEEVIELSRVAASYGGFYTSHLREEGPGLIEAVEEAVRIAEEAGIPVNLTHHKALGMSMWSKSVETLRLVDRARARGLDVTVDQYPYTASSTGLGVLFPSWCLAGGRDSLKSRLENPGLNKEIYETVLSRLEHERGGLTVTIASCGHDPALAGKNLKEILEDRGVTLDLNNAAALVLELQIAGGASCIYHVMSEEDVERIMRHPCTMIASDGTVLPFGSGVPHPRSYGTFPRVLGRYVRDRGVLSLEDAVRKMTSLPAQRAGLADRGVVRPGMVADLVIFDPATVIDKGTFRDPHQYPEGIGTVLVNGEVVLEQGKLTGRRPGKVLRRPGATVSAGD